MAKNAVASEELASKFRTEKETHYTRWVKAEGLDIISAHYVRNLRTVDLKPWARRGGAGVYINHEASRTSNDCYVCEIPAGGKLAPQRQLFEEMILTLSGRGSTTVWNDEGKRITFEWKDGALFAIPLNCWHQHFNGAGGGHIRFNMAKGSMNSHISQFPICTYKKGHAHGPGAHVIVLSGEGFSLMWPEGEEPQRYDWEVGTLIVPPNMWFHQHFNTGTTPSRYLAFKHEVVSIRNAQGVPKAWISRRVGGDQIDYADETPTVRKMFADELAKHGMTPRMDQAYAQELADLPPLAKAG